MLQLHDSSEDELSVDLTGRNTHLSNLFDDNVSNQPLSYTAPKDPKSIIKTPAQAINREKSPLLASCTVNVFKLVNNVYESIGRANAALFNTNDKITLLFYKTKQVQIVSIDVVQDFKFNILDNNYASFYDSTRQHWSVLFEDENKLAYFAKQVVYAKLKSCDREQITTFNQDLNSITDGQLITSNSSIEIELLVTNADPNNKILHEKSKIKINSGKLNSNIEKKLIGMKLNSQVIIVLTDKEIEKNKIPKLEENNDLSVIYVTILRIKENKIETVVPQNENNKTEVKNEPTTNSDKDALLKRMSRVGQAILPTPSIGVVVGDKKQMVPPQLPVKPQIVANAELEQPKLSTLQEISQNMVTPQNEPNNLLSEIKPSRENQSFNNLNLNLQSEEQNQQFKKISQQLSNIEMNSSDLKLNMTCLQKSLNEIKSFESKEKMDDEVKMYYKSIKDIFEENNQMKKDLLNKNERIEKLNNLITDKLLEISVQDSTPNVLKEENFDLKMKIKELTREIQNSKDEHSEKSEKIQNNEFNSELKAIMTNLYMEIKENFSEVNDINGVNSLEITLTCIKKITTDNLKKV